ncbi:MAG: hypothetical protein LBV00_10480 [Propionibacteriaceae bacterium]|jgi:hypothetical protein|nr:hypothetical protein [Propionibacteriaceae bacterium]
MSLIETTATIAHARLRGAERPKWVLAAPFRAHVNHLMSTAQVPWPAIAYQAGLPPATLRTLLFGRNGKIRTKITQQAATRLIELRPEDLSWMRRAQVPADTAGMRIRLMRSHGLTWERIAGLLNLDHDQCQAIARGERSSCSAVVGILAQVGCEAIGVEPGALTLVH